MLWFVLVDYCKLLTLLVSKHEPGLFKLGYGLCTFLLEKFKQKIFYHFIAVCDCKRNSLIE